MLIELKMDEWLKMTQIIEDFEKGYVASCKHLSSKLDGATVGAARPTYLETVGSVSHVKMP